MDNPETELEPDPDMDYILHRPFHRHRLLRLYPDENVRQNVDRGQNVDQHGVASVRQRSAPPLSANIPPPPGRYTLLAEICIQILHSQPRCFWVLNDRNMRVVLN